MGKKRIFTALFLTVIFIIAFSYRFYGLKLNTPFWVDEFYTASQARLVQLYGLSVFNQPGIYFEYHNIIPHFLVGLFFNLFGQKEWITRLPFVIIGSFVPIATFFLARMLFNTPTAVSAVLLTVFSYLEITWSRQARGYILQQLLILLSFILYFHLTQNRKSNLFAIFAFIVILFLGLLTHSTFNILILILILHFALTHRSKWISLLKSPITYIGFGFLIFVLYFIGMFQTFLRFLSSGIFGANNLWYYHSFLWREYGLISFLAIIGMILGIHVKKKEISALAIYLAAFLIFLSFIFKPYVSRYITPIFPIILIFASYSLYRISLLIKVISSNKLARVLIPIFFVLFIISNGDKFVNRPKKYYSVNHDFREAALIDYDQIYSLIKSRGGLQFGNTAIIDTFPDRAQWYIGFNYKPIFLLRGGNVEGFTHGISRKTTFMTDKKGRKLITKNGPILIAALSDLKRVMQDYPRGYVFIDDISLPNDIIDFAQKHLLKEVYLDHYPLDDNPYSIWPATLYSWGVN